MPDRDYAGVVDHLATAVGSAFAFRRHAGDHGVELTLVAFEQRGGNGHYMQSSAYFEGPAGARLPQGTYVVGHPALGEFALFIVPVERRETVLRYEACFTHER